MTFLGEYGNSWEDCFLFSWYKFRFAAKRTETIGLLYVFYSWRELTLTWDLRASLAWQHHTNESMIASVLSAKGQSAPIIDKQAWNTLAQYN